MNLGGLYSGVQSNGLAMGRGARPAMFAMLGPAREPYHPALPDRMFCLILHELSSALVTRVTEGLLCAWS